MSAQPVEQRVSDPLAPGWVAEPMSVAPSPRHLLPVPPPVPDAVTAAVRGLLVPARLAPEPATGAPAPVPALPVPAPRQELSHDDLAERRQVALAALRELVHDGHG